MKRTAATLIAAATLCATAALAETGRYGTWAPPGSSAPPASASASTENLLTDLKSLVDAAEKAKAADRVFLQDLRDLMARYSRPWTTSILSDDFRDGDFDRNPAWTLQSGKFWVESGYGLRSRAEAGQAQTAGEPRKVSKEELAISILGAVLGAKAQNGGGQAAPAASAPAQGETARLTTRAAIPNAFAMTSELSSWSDQGGFAFAVTQGDAGAGYRLNYIPKQTGRTARLELLRVTARGAAVIETAGFDGLEDQKVHTLDWTRTADGRMTVSVDGKTHVTTRDAAFRDAFTGLELSNTGADVIVKSVTVLGAR
ncbi:MAG: hypothetical protein HQL35_08240 [Alphaproteobacteria bacterium]|nr:hypothetical protein [Alphaproteobacteria bacterium]